MYQLSPSKKYQLAPTLVCQNLIITLEFPFLNFVNQLLHTSYFNQIHNHIEFLQSSQSVYAMSLGSPTHTFGCAGC